MAKREYPRAFCWNGWLFERACTPQAGDLRQTWRSVGAPVQCRVAYDRSSDVWYATVADVRFSERSRESDRANFEDQAVLYQAWRVLDEAQRRAIAALAALEYGPRDEDGDDAD